ncbi:uncharacterized protein LOC125759486 [Rhipicephalus sanguineus]|uniref:uncharacterized protein LOC125759486 n=1 Tax=Rhipicephalus sanguineus TaxID=34632 RepID=UPI0020C221E8|nr:uncharacterized protein LOC125759486 [Rhipicephalus sanguineus]
MASAERLRKVRGTVRASVSRNITLLTGLLRNPDTEAREVNRQVAVLKSKEAEIRQWDIKIIDVIEDEALDKELEDSAKFLEKVLAIFYLDETWVNAGHTKEKVWKDATVSSREDAFRKGLTSGLRTPSGKGGRLIVFHAGSENDFVDRASLVFRAKKSVTSDYHNEMDGPRFERWFKEQLLPNIEPRSIIVMDSAPYQSVQLEKLPSTSSRMAEIQSWLTQKNIPWSNDQLKPELIQLVNQNKHRFSGYRIDAPAKAAGHDIVRLPHYHCEFNPIEMVWSQVKGYIAANNRSFTLAGVEDELQ